MIKLSLPPDKKFSIVGRGDIWVVDNIREKELLAGENFVFKVGEEIEINGTIYRIRGIEAARVGPDWHIDDNIGILVGKPI